MEHLLERRILEELWDGVTLTATERNHMSLCSDCQRQYATFALLRDEFAVARLSEVRPEAEERLFSIIDSFKDSYAPRAAFQRVFNAVTEWVKAIPLWDSRQATGALGVRNANVSNYRLLFGTDETEVELMVEPHNGMLRVMGEVMVSEKGDRNGDGNGLALIELSVSAGAENALETVSDSFGRFALEQVPPGVYLMTITPRHSQVVIIEALELT